MEAEASMINTRNQVTLALVLLIGNHGSEGLHENCSPGALNRLQQSMTLAAYKSKQQSMTHNCLPQKKGALGVGVGIFGGFQSRVLGLNQARLCLDAGINKGQRILYIAPSCSTTEPRVSQKSQM